ncbi:MAG TPA: choice-of-anchor Q domain-containing protein [Verrucomicrobiae bacterium]|nr:choice-of-anchor Q domain-containing protein [Verrucomicrobiae bacterium]
MRLTFVTGIVLSLALAGQAPAVNLLVYNTDDSGAGSLRQCIADNAALGGGSAIIFSNVVIGTITLTSGELLITNNVAIIGPGANALAVDGNAASSVFHFDNGITAAISGLTISNGNASGVLNIHSTLMVSNCTISGNSAGGGGGIYNDGLFGSATLTVITSTFSGNSANSAGGIYNDSYGGSATLTVIASTFSGNSSGYEGGGIYNDGQYGSATLTVITSTFSGNSADLGGGIYNHFCAPGNATLSVVACTFSGNSASSGGGIYNSASGCPDIRTTFSSHAATNPRDDGGATLEIGDTILNAGATGENIANLAGTVTSDGFNLSSDNGGGFLTATGDQINTDPRLGPLANNGGPTQTMALRVGSPAIDQGKNLGTTTDQRGEPRIYIDPNSTLPPGGDGADIGAYEASKLCVTAAQRAGNHLRLDFTTWLGTNYEVQSRSDLTIGSWASLPGSTAGNGGIASTIVSNAFGQSQQFYRIHPVP